MKLFKSLFTLCFLLFFGLTAQAQIKGSGIQYFNTVAQMNAYSPDVNTGSEVAIVTSASLAPVLYTYDRVNTQWIKVESITAGDTGQIDLSIVNGELTATFAQNTANSGEYYTWDGSNWVAKGIDANEVGVTDAGNNYTGSDMEAVLSEIAGQLHAAVTLASSGSSSALTLSGQEVSLSETTLEQNLAVDDLKTLTGINSGATDLGTFTGSVIPDNSTIKAALQSLENLNANAVSAGPTQYYDDAAAGAGGIAVGEFYELALSNRYGGVEGTLRRRQ